MLITKAQKIELLLKHAKKFAENSIARPYLRGIHYSADKCAYVTDAKIALQIGGMDLYDRPITFDAWSGEEIHIKYPDVKSHFEKAKRAVLDIKIHDIRRIAKNVKSMLDIAKSINQAEMKATLYGNPHEDNTAWLKYHQPNEAFVELAIGQIQNHSLELNSFFAIFDILLFHKVICPFADAESEYVLIKYIGQLEPLILIDEQNEISTIVMPRKG